MKKNPLITGTILLTGAGFLSRILGFFYRIFLSRAIGAEGLGVYQMVFPIHSIAFALCCGAIQTSISRLVARNEQLGRAALRTGLFISLSISAVLTLLIWQASPWLARFVLLEPACGPLLPVMALSIPFSSIHACICGYYYGMKRTAVPALSQMAEQLVRMGAVFLMVQVLTENGRPVTVSVAVWGMMIGEAASAVYSYLTYAASETGKLKRQTGRQPENRQASFFQMAGPLMAMAVPLMGNRLILNCLQSLEAIFVPNRLIAFGLSHSDALSLYGVLTGMALPFIFFPSAVTNSLAVVLLPTVAEAQAQDNSSRIEKTIAAALRYSLYMGIFCIGLFTLLGPDLGMTVFRNQTAGQYIAVLAWLCPFMYISTTRKHFKRPENYPFFSQRSLHAGQSGSVEWDETIFGLLSASFVSSACAACSGPRLHRTMGNDCKALSVPGRRRRTFKALCSRPGVSQSGRHERIPVSGRTGRRRQRRIWRPAVADAQSTAQAKPQQPL
ncbi:MAG: oligosaccharide flippase family protein [Clostridium sp.]